MKSRGNIMAVLLGILTVVLAALLAVLFVLLRPPKLSEDKMRECAASAMEAEQAANARPEGEGEEGEGFSRKIEAFEVAAAGSSQGKKAKGKDVQNGAEEPKAEEDNEYLCTYSSERLMTDADVADLNSKSFEGLPQGKSIIQMVINEMYARYGYQFQNAEIQAYFDKKKWYQDIPVKNPDMDQVSGSMTSTERSNVEFLSGHI